MDDATFFGVTEFESYPVSISKLLEKAKTQTLFKALPVIILKPNLVNATKFPVTTSVECCKAVIEFIRACSDAHIIIAEGCGDPGLETSEIFSILGYTKLIRSHGVELVDLNNEPLVELENHNNTIFPTMFLPKLVFDQFLFSLPVLKAHSLAGITGTLKNMMGIAPPRHYSENGFWKKGMFHEQMQQSITELNRYRIPDLTLLDASVGLCDYHLGGATCNPPVNKLVLSNDAYKVDQYAAELLGIDPETIQHIHTHE